MYFGFKLACYFRSYIGIYPKPIIFSSKSGNLFAQIAIFIFSNVINDFMVIFGNRRLTGIFAGMLF